MTVAAPPLSVIIPTRNTRHLTLACLASLGLARSAEIAPESELEVIVVDDAGTDGTAEAVAERFPAVSVLRQAEQVGFTRAANAGLGAARGELLLLLNSDTEVETAGLAAMRAQFAARARLGVAGASLRYADGTAQWSGGEEPTAPWMFALASGLGKWAGRLPIYRRLRPVSGTAGRAGRRRDEGEGAEAGARRGREVRQVAWVTGAAMAMRRAVWEAVGPLDERFRFYAQDLDFCLRAGDAGWDVAVLAEWRVLHHHGATIAREAPARELPAVAVASGGAGSEPQQRDKPGGAGNGSQHLELLWSDLARWAVKRRGGGDGGSARGRPRHLVAALRAGGRLRLWGRRAAALFAGRARRESYDTETAAVAAALRAMAAAEATAQTC